MTILVQLQEKLKPLLNFQIYKSFQDFLYHPDEELLFITPIDASLNSDKSTSKCLPVKILKLLKKFLLTSSFSSGVFPSILKITKVHKSKLFRSNYRSLSLLPNIDKIIQKIMYNRTYKFLDKKSGFQQHYSTLYALLNLTEAVMKTLDHGNFACGIFVGALSNSAATPTNRHPPPLIFTHPIHPHPSQIMPYTPPPTPIHAKQCPIHLYSSKITHNYSK